MATNENDNDDVVSQTAPVELDGGVDDVEYVTEGSAEAEAQKATPSDELSGSTKEQLASQLKELQSRLQNEQQFREAVTKLQTPQVVVQQSAVAQTPQNVETQEAKRQRINQKFLENPAEAMEELQREALNPVLGVIIKGQEDFSKEILLKDPDQKGYYDKYKDEVDSEVNKMQPTEKIQNVRIYQNALERVKSRHQGDIVQDLVAAEVKKTLEKLGIDPAKLGGQPAVASLAGKQTTAAPSTTKKTTVVVPRWVAEQAERQGVSPSIMYEMLKSKGQVR